jgi:hypothetical protein
MFTSVYEGAENFNDANVLTSAFLDLRKAQVVIREKTGMSWLDAVSFALLLIGVIGGKLVAAMLMITGVVALAAWRERRHGRPF